MLIDHLHFTLPHKHSCVQTSQMDEANGKWTTFNTFDSYHKFFFCLFCILYFVTHNMCRCVHVCVCLCVCVWARLKFIKTLRRTISAEILYARDKSHHAMMIKTPIGKYTHIFIWARVTSVLWLDMICFSVLVIVL